MYTSIIDMMGLFLVHMYPSTFILQILYSSFTLMVMYPYIRKHHYNPRLLIKVGLEI